jgi:hypothetical protein
MKCCKECPEYDLCEDKKKCCDMCDFYNPKTKKCAKIKKSKKKGKELPGRKKIEDAEEDAEEAEPLENEEGLESPEEEDEDTNPYENEEFEDFYNN